MEDDMCRAVPDHVDLMSCVQPDESRPLQLVAVKLRPTGAVGVFQIIGPLRFIRVAFEVGPDDWGGAKQW